MKRRVQWYDYMNEREIEWKESIHLPVCLDRKHFNHIIRKRTLCSTITCDDDDNNNNRME